MTVVAASRVVASRLLTAALCGLLSACGGSSQPSAESGRPDVVLISVDTLRADALGVYGYGRETSPVLDALASRAFVFERAYAHSPNTIVSHASLMSSLHPVRHGARQGHPLPTSIVTLAEELRSQGYATAAFTTHGDWLTRELGFAQGFDHFESVWRNADENNGRIARWLGSGELAERRREGAPLFLFVHYFDVHSDWVHLPYQTQTDFDQKFVGDQRNPHRACYAGECASRFLAKMNSIHRILASDHVEWIRALYDGGVAYTDDRIGRLLEELRARGLFENSWIVVTSDHGEEFQEHGKFLHLQPYQETARVPLILRPPWTMERRSIAAVVGLVDVMPTILELAGVGPDPDHEGRSLLPLMQGGEVEERRVFFNEYHEPGNVTVRDETFTLVGRDDFSDLELYEVAADPGERRNVVSRYPEQTKRMVEIARAFHERELERRTLPDGGAAEPSAEELDRLRSLGYAE